LRVGKDLVARGIVGGFSEIVDQGFEFGLLVVEIVV